MSIGPIKSISDAFAFPFQIGFGATDGAMRGLSDGFFKADLSKDLLEETGTPYKWVRKPIYNLFASGLQNLNVATSEAKFATVMKSEGFGKACTSILQALGKHAGGSGFVMLGVLGAALLSSAVLGWKGLSNTRHIIDEHDRGHVAHIVQSNLFHVAKGIGFVGMIGGPLMCLTPLGAAAGLSLAAASAITAGGLALLGSATNGFNVFNYPEKAGFIGRRVIRLFNEVTGRG